MKSQKLSSIVLGITIGVSSLMNTGCNPSKGEKQSPHRYTNQETALVNLAIDDGIVPYAVVDENRDGQADYIATSEHQILPGDKNRILYLREGFHPESPLYRTNKYTRKMSHVIQYIANEVLLNQASLRIAIQRDNQIKTEVAK